LPLAPSLPRRALEEVAVVQLLHREEALRARLAQGDAPETAEVLEAFDAGRDDDEEVGVGPGTAAKACGLPGGTMTRSPG
jgi:hypothetical protein